MNHTPGPWKIQGIVKSNPAENLPNGYSIITERVTAWRGIAAVWSRDLTQDPECDTEAASNAALIAAATELLEACKLAYCWINGDDCGANIGEIVVLDRLLAAIAKAEEKK